jgi:PIN domain nuclease of toxin-antitoxin system
MASSAASIFDSSAILAYLLEEKELEVIEAALEGDGRQMTSVNYCEVLGKLIEKGMPADEADEAVRGLGVQFVNFELTLARYAAVMREGTRAIGASLGDRACLALAMRCTQSRQAATVFTADPSWSRVKWPFKIVVIRAGRSGR